MTDEELIARLRREANTDGYDYHGDLHEKSADRIEALTKERDDAEQRGYANAMEAERKLHEDRIEALTGERDRWKDACRSASRDLNIVVPDNDRLKSERDAAEAKLAKAVEVLEDIKRYSSCGDTRRKAIETLAEIKGESQDGMG